MVYPILVILIVALDQWVKHFVTVHIELNTSQSFIPGLLSLANIHNSGAAYSMLMGKTVFFYVITTIALIVLLVLFVRAQENSWLYLGGLTLMFAGALGNLIDRVHFKYVVDMFQLDFINFPIFNVADSALTVGVVLLFIYVLVDGKE
ncbi:lipoprotein signal peptidase [Lactobacillus selangorensis]|uniref:Lipoprotein signal peptidase n=1 Tax=Lactobacillus selangorensis TaxID=81857 RepID=A0A0R2G8V0_9LACO|nr:lipoprotein signal peptidase [Lactobacillus selangorensis]KRN33991.1 lipoprotein signal peptidase [Lactobacillus selangorensis]